MDKSDIVPFGKYKNKHIDVLIADKEYIKWLVNQVFIYIKNGEEAERDSNSRDEIERLCSIQEAADHLRLSIHTIRMWIRSGKIASHKLGGRVFISEGELRRLIDQSRRS